MPLKPVKRLGKILTWKRSLGRLTKNWETGALRLIRTLWVGVVRMR
jgi:hypothetical protein